jgi:hypothetical protein
MRLQIDSLNTVARPCISKPFITGIVRSGISLRRMPTRSTPSVKEYFNPYLNFHWPCRMPELINDTRHRWKSSGSYLVWPRI